MLGRIYHLLRKEFLQLRRDKSAWLRLLVPPIIQMLLFGYAATFEVFNVATVIVDQDQTQESRALVAAFVHSSRFKLAAVATDRRQVQDAVESSTALDEVDYGARLCGTCEHRNALTAAPHQGRGVGLLPGRLQVRLRYWYT